VGKAAGFEPVGKSQAAALAATHIVDFILEFYADFRLGGFDRHYFRRG
jgi:hypothetical protein